MQTTTTRPQALTDANGVKWRREFEPLVCNDFGDLVEVPA